jgi:2-deoxy-D-gluconate 3-dehydrogenase
MDEKIKGFSLEYFKLDGKAAIVTGGNGSIGQAFAVALAKAGANIVIAHRKPNVEEIRKEIVGLGREVVLFQGDLTEEKSRKGLIEACLSKFGRIDILVNAAGVSYFEDFEEYSDETYRKVIDINLNAVYYLGHEVGKIMMKQRSGKIINVGSALSFTADKNCPPYVISKHGILGLTKDFSNEMGKYGVQTNAICPGFFNSALTANIDPEIKEQISAKLPDGHWGELRELMGPVVFLASNASDYINGWYINVDGGYHSIL